jgi:hypothetical protein
VVQPSAVAAAGGFGAAGEGGEASDGGGGAERRPASGDKGGEKPGGGGGFWATAGGLWGGGGPLTLEACLEQVGDGWGGTERGSEERGRWNVCVVRVRALVLCACPVSVRTQASTCSHTPHAHTHRMLTHRVPTHTRSNVRAVCEPLPSSGGEYYAVYV